MFGLNKEEMKKLLLLLDTGYRYGFDGLKPNEEDRRILSKLHKGIEGGDKND